MVTPVRPMFDTICTLPLSADLFAQVVHPSEPLVAVGLSSGHVATLKLPPVDDDDVVQVHASARQARGRRGSNGTDMVDTAWRTKRHKGSCRCLAYSVDGRQLYSAGTDGVVKAADSETGRVTGKVAIPAASSTSQHKIEGPTVIHVLSPQTLLLGTDSGALHLYDLRDPAPRLPLDDTKPAFTTGRPAQTHYPHTDDISSLTPLPPSSASTSGYSKQWLTTGGTTLALTDLRRGVLVKSEDQEELLLSSLYITGLPAKKSTGSSGQKALVGGADGVITLWEKGQWDDQDERINVSREKETLDVMAEIPDGVGGFGKKIAVGMGDGRVRFVRLGMNKVVGEVQHDEVEGVVELGFDVGGRMISGGGQVVKVWREHMEAEEEEEEEVEAEAVVGGKRVAGSDDGEQDGDSDEGDSSEEEEKPKKRKKRKRGKGPTAVSSLSFAGLD
ncbi:WD repeat-containing protein jip5 [Oleoguttula mirabilis]|uniref:WD repeat-containing protein JIP5 n=1 Tax=Oleoguttula mirabilis TaxID=1507867 RepID=A0AAV9JJP7_9PEZI|nr:WD repeat-containing protein jip5 [Oleoguttula mirabilis]